MITHLHGTTPFADRPTLTGFLRGSLRIVLIVGIVDDAGIRVSARNRLFRNLALGDFPLGGRLDLGALGVFLLGRRLVIGGLVDDVGGLLHLPLRILPSSSQRKVFFFGRRRRLV